jgi:hypothetical protein
MNKPPPNMAFYIISSPFRRDVPFLKHYDLDIGLPLDTPCSLLPAPWSIPTVVAII